MVTTKKKTTDKSTTKATKKTSGLTKVKRRIPEDKRFVLSNGQVIGSLKELALELDNLGDDVFYYHVNEERNDFSNWLKDVLKEMELAEHLMDAKEKHDFQMKLLKHIVKQV